MNPGNKEILMWSAFLAGDKDGFAQLYHFHYNALEAYAQKLLADTGLVQECIQDLFVKLWNNRANLQKTASPRHYLLKALRHIIFNKVKAGQRIKSIGGIEDFDSFLLVVKEPDHAEWEFSHDLQASINKLTPRQKEIIYLYFVEDCSYEEIAEILLMTRKATYKLLYRAVENLRTTKIFIK